MTIFGIASSQIAEEYTLHVQQKFLIEKDFRDNFNELAYICEMTGMDYVQASIHFLAHNELYLTEQPYSLRYTGEDRIARSNIILDRHDDILIHDIRGRESDFSLEKNGFTISPMYSRMQYHDFDYPDRIVAIYLPEIASHLKEILGARHVQVYEHLIRKRDAKFPISTGGEYAFDQPTSTAHIDATPAYIDTVLDRLNGNRKDGMRKHHVQCINVWRPLRGPLLDWPLAICDAGTVHEEDLVTADQVYPQHITENIQLHYGPWQQWYYLSKQRPHELLVFRQTDTAPETLRGGGCPHSSFANPLSSHDENPRESIEARVLVYFGECYHDKIHN